MNQLPLYKKTLALLLLSLQVFISTPVRLFHHHKHGSAVLNKTHHATISENCPICDHHYTAHYKDFLSADGLYIHSPFSAPHTEIKQALPCVFYFGISNKSPPSFS